MYIQASHSPTPCTQCKRLCIGSITSHPELSSWTTHTYTHSHTHTHSHMTCRQHTHTHTTPLHDTQRQSIVAVGVSCLWQPSPPHGSLHPITEGGKGATASLPSFLSSSHPWLLVWAMRWSGRGGGTKPASPGVESLSLLLGDSPKHLLRQVLRVGEHIGGCAQLPHRTGHHCRYKTLQL